MKTNIATMAGIAITARALARRVIAGCIAIAATLAWLHFGLRLTARRALSLLLVGAIPLTLLYLPTHLIRQPVVRPIALISGYRQELTIIMLPVAILPGAEQ